MSSRSPSMLHEMFPVKRKTSSHMLARLNTCMLLLAYKVLGARASKFHRHLPLHNKQQSVGCYCVACDNCTVQTNVEVKIYYTALHCSTTKCKYSISTYGRQNAVQCLSEKSKCSNRTRKNRKISKYRTL